MTQKVFGFHAVKALLSNRRQDVKTVLMSAVRKDKRLAEVERLVQSMNIEFSKVSNEVLNQLSEGVRHQGVIALCFEEKFEQRVKDVDELLELAPQPALLVVLDGIEDPRNLGACLRSAHAGGAHGIILPNHRGAKITEVASRTAAGSAESIPIVKVSNLARNLAKLKSKGVWVFGMDVNAKSTIFDTSFSEPCALVFGSEGSGLRRLTRESCDQLTQIPMLGDTESFNVSVAVGIATVEVTRQRGLP